MDTNFYSSTLLLSHNITIVELISREKISIEYTIITRNVIAALASAVTRRCLLLWKCASEIKRLSSSSLYQARPQYSVTFVECLKFTADLGANTIDIMISLERQLS